MRSGRALTGAAQAAASADPARPLERLIKEKVVSRECSTVAQTRVYLISPAGAAE